MKTNNLGERIRDRRLQLNLSQDELARRTGYGSRSSINKVEMGTRSLDQKKIMIFANALCTTPVYLLGQVDDPEWKMPEDEDTMHLNLIEKEIVTAYRLAGEEKQKLVLYLLGITQK